MLPERLGITRTALIERWIDEHNLSNPESSAADRQLP
jgi:hypothetical protein